MIFPALYCCFTTRLPLFSICGQVLRNKPTHEAAKQTAVDSLMQPNANESSSLMEDKKCTMEEHILASHLILRD